MAKKMKAEQGRMMSRDRLLWYSANHPCRLVRDILRDVALNKTDTIDLMQIAENPLNGVYNLMTLAFGKESK